ncbi:Abi family protein [Prauserella halophila]|uniref:Abi family protein n=1 Tax=Prauserella halophila TaxID=185641 RepID=A0ABN1WB86_9PSEU|nr:Abi family protein [Prauserella halophila]MCP2234793.1 Abortive infection bacteriophage resistance protein [Prauserella halophila]
MSRKSPRARGSLRYEKPPLTLDELMALLSDRGLHIPDPEKTGRYLRHIGYYRLSPYTIPFQQRDRRPDHVFRPGTSFEDVLDLYVFDRALRLLVMDALERIEVAVRAALTDHMSTAHGGSHWYMAPSHFKNRDKHTTLLRIVREGCEDQLRRAPDVDDGSLVHPSALEHYLTTYCTPDLPPSWLMVETLTIGQLDNTIRNLRRRGDQTAIAAGVGLTAPVLDSWMRTYVRVRNICAHHGRLWNVGLGVPPAIPQSKTISWLRSPLPDSSRERLYPVLVSLQSVLDAVSPHSSWARRLHELVVTRPRANLVGMGIPEGWVDDPFWNRHLG